jgi:small subunit ribosomal protein S16
MGSRNAAFYRVIVQDARRAPTGRFIETLGWYDPKQDGNNFSLNLDRVDYWLGNGAQPSDTASSLIKKARTLPVEQAAAGEVKEEEIPASALEAEAAAAEAEADEPEADEPAAEAAAAEAEEPEAETEKPVAETGEPVAETAAEEDASEKKPEA